MRSDYRPGGRMFGLSWSATNILIVSLVVAFFIQNTSWFVSKEDYFMLTPDVFRRGFVWQLLTYQFLHAGISHLLFNGISLWSFGNMVEYRLGRGRFFALYFLSGIAGGILQALAGLAIPHLFGGATVGASAGIFGVVAAFALLDPDARILLYFLIPVRAMNLLYISIAAAVFLPFVWNPGGVAHAAHLGGILFGIFYIRRGLEWSLSFPNLFRQKSRKTTTTRATIFPVRRARPADTAELPPQEFISQEVDPILDKISAHGIQSLTERERQILQAARNRMSKR